MGTKVRAIILGASGMVGEGVLHECILHPDVESILVIGRRSCGVQHAKIKEIVHPNLFDLSLFEEQFRGYNACYFCLGVSSVGMNKEMYRHITYDLTLHVASLLVKNNPDMSFCYISGAGTDSSEKGNSRWARVKGKTENDIAKLPFKSTFAFRPGFIRPIQGLKHTLWFASVLAPLFPVFKILFPKIVVTLEDLGKAMINSTIHGYSKSIVECEDITLLANSPK